MFAALLDPVDAPWPLVGEGMDWLSLAQAPAPGTPYGRVLLHASSAGEVLLLQWAPGIATAPHDHGGASGWVRVLQGTLEEQRYSRQGQSLIGGGWRARPAGSLSEIGPEQVHAMRQPAAGAPALSLHVYRPLAPRGMRLFPEQGAPLRVGLGCGAWWPTC